MEFKELCAVIPSEGLRSGWFSGREVEVYTVGEDQDMDLKKQDKGSEVLICIKIIWHA